VGDADLAKRVFEATKIETPALERARVAREVNRALAKVLAIDVDPYALWFATPRRPGPLIFLAVLPSFLDGFRNYVFRWHAARDDAWPRRSDTAGSGKDPAEAPLCLTEIWWSTNARFRPFHLGEFKWVQRGCYEVGGEFLTAYNATSIATLERRGLPAEHSLLPAPEVPRLHPTVLRGRDAGPCWTGWDRRLGLVPPRIGPVFFAEERPGGSVVACAEFQGGWSDETLALLRQESARLLPGRHAWLLHSVGDAQLVLFCGRHSIESAVGLHKSLAEAKASLVRLTLLLRLAEASACGWSPPSTPLGTTLPAPEKPAGILRGVQTPGTHFLPNIADDERELRDDPGWIKMRHGWAGQEAEDLVPQVL
jgi:hypothetical protein